MRYRFPTQYLKFSRQYNRSRRLHCKTTDTLRDRRRRHSSNVSQRRVLRFPQPTLPFQSNGQLVGSSRLQHTLTQCVCNLNYLGSTRHQCSLRQQSACKANYLPAVPSRESIRIWDRCWVTLYGSRRQRCIHGSRRQRCILSSHTSRVTYRPAAPLEALRRNRLHNSVHPQCIPNRVICRPRCRPRTVGHILRSRSPKWGIRWKIE